MPVYLVTRKNDKDPAPIGSYRQAKTKGEAIDMVEKNDRSQGEKYHEYSATKCAQQTKDHPITTKAGKRQFIKHLSKNMEQKFLDKLDHVPDTWDGIEIRAYMATEWAKENPFDARYSPVILDTDAYKAHEKRAKKFKNDLITSPL